MLYVYRHIRLDKNVPFYIGIGAHCPENKEERYRRACSHDRSKYWKGVVAKTEYRVEILFENLSRDQATEKEKELIQLYGRVFLKTGTLINLTAGGDGMFDLCESLRTSISEKISKALKGRKKSDEHKLSLSKSKLGKKRGPMSDEQKAIRSVKLKGRKRSDVSDRNRNRLNPIAGKIFITDGKVNKMIHPNETIPVGWYKGIIKNKIWNRKK